MNKSEFDSRVRPDSWLGKRLTLIAIDSYLWLLPFDLVIICSEDDGKTIKINGSANECPRSDFKLYAQKPEDLIGGGGGGKYP